MRQSGFHCCIITSYHVGPLTMDRGCHRAPVRHIRMVCEVHQEEEWTFVCEKHRDNVHPRGEHEVDQLCLHPDSVPTDECCILPEEEVEALLRSVQEAPLVGTR